MANVKREPMSADLLRQRRNLLITSLILIAINIAGAKPKKEVSVLGAGIEFENPERLVWGIWILWAYFLLRYIQYLSEETDLGIRNGVRMWIISRYQAKQDQWRSHLTFSWLSRFRWELHDGDYEPGNADWQKTVAPYNRWQHAGWAICAFASTAVRTPRFTDYILPLIVAAIPVFLIAADYVLTKL